MTKYLVAYISTLAAFLVLDGLWLGVLMGSTYKAQLGSLMLDSPKILPAALFYLFYVVGIIVFAILSGIEAQQWQRAALLGVLLGLMAYGAYDMTNLATLKGWPVTITLIDIAWGAVVTGLSATAGYFAVNAWASR
ncbi:MAG: DUF2177 family protein [Comamonadaceae bacterium]|nr:MAG: DUF2177 family protein [Comamonadaceae bacterium]